ncbi:glycerol-3-phosphate dehydrogenase/oxidase [Labilibaculum sp. DW002]|uniref:Glycerol-3-phosphate dehydrogenase/oxidase n=1 Tax=Paralabilibaculum antarcticum TaxID=2912572 RepID=A0ABT5W0Y7_9BACT|nr:glycerol-3-phosphate dehydrogenase/oxidase [Labilibaculum sp. DW002]MDE5420239.1 glycerol-3-phosphate dehydrogenase/oxidase [Labilibaculum sp. DW002]
MKRDKMIREIESLDRKWDVIIVGGGASGLGSAIESATRGYKTLLLEQDDFAKGTSSRSTKLVHGGVRYLAQGNISLVLEALRERGLMKQNAPHLVKDQSFIIPNYTWWGTPYYTLGLTMYDLMAGKLGYGRSLPFSKKRTLKYIPTLKSENLCGGVVYHDGQFDDARLAINLCQTFVENGGVALNYMKVEGIQKSNGKVNAVSVRDMESGKTYALEGKVVLNATGVFVDEIIKMDEPKARDIVKVSQGVHLVLDKEFIPGDYALMIPKTSDGRVLFAVPWHNKVVVGTTDVHKDTAELEPRALEEEVNFILETAGRFLAKPPKRSDVRSVFAGLRPLAAPSGEGKKTKEISRGHKIVVSKSGMVTLTGGKWTTYRQMAEDVMNTVANTGGLPEKKSVTRNLKIHGYKKNVDLKNPMYFYGADEEKILSIAKEEEGLAEYLSEKLKVINAQVVWGARYEMARTVEDILSRRTRCLLLDAEESIKMAPKVAELLAKELGYDKAWEENQVEEYRELASRYILQ